MRADCNQCDQLWQEYENAARSHTTIVAQYQIAILRQDSAAIAKLEPVLKQATERRRNARQAVERHDASHDKR
jgi:hypothetical protein